MQNLSSALPIFGEARPALPTVWMQPPGSFLGRIRRKALLKCLLCIRLSSAEGSRAAIRCFGALVLCIKPTSSPPIPHTWCDTGKLRLSSLANRPFPQVFWWCSEAPPLHFSWCRRWSSNPSGKCSYERPTRGTVCGTMRCMCGADAGCWQ